MLSYSLTALAATVAFCTLSSAVNITVFQPGVPLAPSPLPPPGAASNSDKIVAQFNLLGRTTVWNLVKKIKFEGDTGEPEGMINLGEERYIISTGHYTSSTVSYGNHTIVNGTDRTPGSGYGRLSIYDGQGQQVADATLSAVGDIEYHIGGIDYDGTKIWATFAQYRPNTTATIISVDPHTMDKTVLLHYRDHLGGIVHDPAYQQLVTLNWGSRNATTWNLQATANPYPQFSFPTSTVRNPSFWADYQDCKFLGHPAIYNYRSVMICSGVTSLSSNVTIGGLALIDTATMIPLSEVPITMVSDLGTIVTENPFDVDIVNGRLRVYFLPDQHNSTLYIYEPVQNSPYEY